MSDIVERLRSMHGWAAEGADEIAHLRSLVEAKLWQPIENAPKDGTWIIAICNDRSRLYRMSWGRSRDDKLCWCDPNKVVSYGDGLFSPHGGWILSPSFSSDKST